MRSLVAVSSTLVTPPAHPSRPAPTAAYERRSPAPPRRWSRPHGPRRTPSPAIRCRSPGRLCPADRPQLPLGGPLAAVPEPYQVVRPRDSPRGRAAHDQAGEAVAEPGAPRGEADVVADVAHPLPVLQHGLTPAGPGE